MESCFNCNLRMGEMTVVVRLHQRTRSQVAALCGHCWFHTFLQPGAHSRLADLFIDDVPQKKQTRAQPGKGRTLGSEIS
jgi:hypothetical protein